MAAYESAEVDVEYEEEWEGEYVEEELEEEEEKAVSDVKPELKKLYQQHLLAKI